MYKRKKSFFFILLVALVVSGGYSSTAGDETHYFEWKNTYVGDNSSVASILHTLPNEDYFIDFELKTKEKPYGMVLNYNEIPGMTVSSLKEDVLYSATIIFALVHNADWVDFNFGEQTTRVSRTELQEWYGFDLNSNTNREELIKIINDFSEDSKIRRFPELKVWNHSIR
ncbi:hypothetical protein JOC85_001809 [Bacillus mesophilus]|uniref:DUF4825 domain-containing protein n=1 Tax=Bacillus mesophilus TaxID=1808955 RepID=A0A6M0Q4W8_9BACI|nr:DUF4825 domain-containing protein [Bacillus mesophilus]MBM7661037.1 hypothetical protein [Bacillus mesophilus]NEY71425.1 DUF4825 domain-containing protein [Bacillus mesophilus]